MANGPTERKTNITFKNNDDYESYINALDVDYYSQDGVFTGYVYKLITPEFNRVIRSPYGRSTVFKQNIVEYIGNKCFIPTSGNCFIKCIKYFTNKGYREKFLTFIRTEKYRSGVMTSARIQPFCKKNLSTLVVLMVNKYLLETLPKEIHHCS